MKGFVNSLVTVVIAGMMLELLLYTQAFTNMQSRMEGDTFSIMYSDYYFDDLSYDVRSMDPSVLNMERINSTYMQLSFNETASYLDFGAPLDYAYKISQLAPQIGVSFQADASEIASNSLTHSFSNGVSHTDNFGSVLTTLTSSSANLKNISIFFSTNLTGASVQNFTFDPGGDVYVTLNYTDASGSFVSSGAVDSSSPVSFLVDFTERGSYNATISRASEHASYSSIKNSISGSNISVSAVLEGADESVVYATIPVSINVNHFIYSKSGDVEALRG